MEVMNDFLDEALSLHYSARVPRAMAAETRWVVEYARRFNEEVTRVLGLQTDRRTHEDPSYVPDDLLKICNEWGLYTLWVPKIFGGQGYNMPSLAYFVEQVASVCLGIANIIGVHYLGVTGMMMASEAPVIRRVMREVVAGEHSGKPCVIALAITEPSGGTDVEEIEHLLDKGKVRCLAKRVPGGYVLNGTKIFISMGSLSEWTVVYGYTDLKHPADTMVAMMVKRGMPCFSVGRHEDKMGQRACPANVIDFEDCFVPDDLVMLDAERIRRATSRPPRETWMRHIDYIVSITRPVVAAFGTGAGRGAFEAVCAYVAMTELEGRPMINHEWVQCRLAEMYRNVRLSQFAYAEGNNANGHRGPYNLLQMWPMYGLLRYTPRWAFDKVMSPLLSNRLGSWLLRKWYYDWQKPEDQHLCTGLGSLAKFTCTELGLENCQMALEIMGQHGLRHDNGLEKILRDVKLLQIYEGTNQLNRLNLFKSLVAPKIAQATPFAD